MGNNTDGLILLATFSTSDNCQKRGHVRESGSDEGRKLKDQLVDQPRGKKKAATASSWQQSLPIMTEACTRLMQKDEGKEGKCFGIRCLRFACLFVFVCLFVCLFVGISQLVGFHGNNCSCKDISGAVLVCLLWESGQV